MGYQNKNTKIIEINSHLNKKEAQNRIELLNQMFLGTKQ